MTPIPARLKEDVQLIKKWMSKQPHLPKVEDEEWLITFLHHNKYSLEKTINKLDNYFSFRTQYPELFKNRDPTSPEILQLRVAHKFVFADKRTKEGNMVIFAQFQPDTSIYDMKSVLKWIFMMCDTSLLQNERYQSLVIITDCCNFSYIHFLKSLHWLKPLVDIFFNAYSDRVKGIHMVNAPAHLDIAFNTFKGFLPQKIADRYHVCSNMENLCSLVDEDIVCSEFGGKGPSLAHYEEYTYKRLLKHKKWFLEQDDVCTNEALRRKTDDKIEEMRGSFRKLEVDSLRPPPL